MAFLFAGFDSTAAAPSCTLGLLAANPDQQASLAQTLLRTVDDEKSSRDRVVLAHKAVETYDASHYETQLVRAAGSVLSPLGWDRTDIRRGLSGERDAVLSSFGGFNELS